MLSAPSDSTAHGVSGHTAPGEGGHILRPATPAEMNTDRERRCVVRRFSGAARCYGSVGNLACGARARLLSTVTPQPQYPPVRKINGKEVFTVGPLRRGVPARDRDAVGQEHKGAGTHRRITQGNRSGLSPRLASRGNSNGDSPRQQEPLQCLFGTLPSSLRRLRSASISPPRSD